MHSEHHQPDDLYIRLVNLVAANGCHVIDAPDKARAAFDKARLHPRLVGAGISVPWTWWYRGDGPRTGGLTRSSVRRLAGLLSLSQRWVTGRQGLVLDAQSEVDIEASITAWPDAHYLFQKRVLPRDVNGRPVYFRAFHAFGEIWITWWNCYTDHYRLVEPGEWDEFGLSRVESMVRQIAELTGMTFFSTEIVQTERANLS
jgi:hypothetical protein